MQVVLVGQIGSGKTTLYNRITDSYQPAGYGGKSITISVYSKYAAYGNVPFKVLDTPGFGCIEKKILHYAGIIAALTDAPVTRILLVVRFDKIENMWKFVLPALAPLRRFRQLISLMITHWDKCENQDGDRQLIEQHFEENNIKSFIYTSKDEDPILTCEKIIKEFQKSQPEVIKFMESELTTQFDLLEFKGELEFQIECFKGDIIELFHQKTSSLKQFILKFELPELKTRYKCYLNEMKEEKALLLLNFGFFSKKMPEVSKIEYEFCEILHQVTLQCSKIAEECIQEFMSQQSDKLDVIVQENGQNSLYLIHSVLKKELQTNLIAIQEMAQKKMFEVSGHCFNNIRKCNYCGQIWLKSVGCEGSTYCGAVPKNNQINLSYSQHKWSISLDIEKNQFLKIVKFQSFTSQQKMNDLQQKQIKQIQPIEEEEENEQYVERKIGCGQRIEWSSMQQLSKGELQELVDPGIFSFLSQQDLEITAQLAATNQQFLQLMKMEILQQKKKMKQN